VTFSYFAYFLNSGSSAMLLHSSAALRFAIPLRGHNSVLTGTAAAVRTQLSRFLLFEG
jgi:hypothetical protein